MLAYFSCCISVSHSSWKGEDKAATMLYAKQNNQISLWINERLLLLDVSFVVRDSSPDCSNLLGVNGVYFGDWGGIRFKLDILSMGRPWMLVGFAFYCGCHHIPICFWGLDLFTESTSSSRIPQLSMDLPLSWKELPRGMMGGVCRAHNHCHKVELEQVPYISVTNVDLH